MEIGDGLVEHRNGFRVPPVAGSNSRNSSLKPIFITPGSLWTLQLSPSSCKSAMCVVEVIKHQPSGGLAAIAARSEMGMANDPAGR